MQGTEFGSENMVTSDTGILVEYQGESQVAMDWRVKQMDLLSIGFIQLKIENKVLIGKQ